MRILQRILLTSIYTLILGGGTLTITDCLIRSNTRNYEDKEVMQPNARVTEKCSPRPPTTIELVTIPLLATGYFGVGGYRLLKRKRSA